MFDQREVVDRHDRRDREVLRHRVVRTEEHLCRRKAARRGGAERELTEQNSGGSPIGCDGGKASSGHGVLPPRDVGVPCEEIDLDGRLQGETGRDVPGVLPRARQRRGDRRDIDRDLELVRTQRLGAHASFPAMLVQVRTCAAAVAAHVSPATRSAPAAASRSRRAWSFPTRTMASAIASVSSGSTSRAAPPAARHRGRDNGRTKAHRLDNGKTKPLG